jgi:CheY-like chemotaxis protein
MAASNLSTVMVVDDERDILSLVESVLKKYHYIVEAYSDPLKALDSYLRNPSRYILIITDIRMPGLTGIELSEKIWQKDPKKKIIFMTAYLVEEFRQTHLRPAISKRDIVEKPFSLERICDEVRLRLPVNT